MFGDYFINCSNYPQNYTFIEELKLCIDELRRLQQFDSDIFKNIYMHNSDSKDGKLYIDLDIDTESLAIKMFDHFKFYKAKWYKKWDGIELTPEMISYNGFSIIITIYDDLQKRRIGFNKRIANTFGSSEAIYMDSSRINKEFDWYNVFFKLTTLKNEKYKIKNTFFTERDFSTRIRTSDDNELARTYMVGNYTYLSNEILKNCDLKPLNSNIKIEKICDGVLFIPVEKELFKSQNQTHYDAVLILQDFFKKNKLYEY